MKKLNFDWVFITLIRSIRTFICTALGLIIVGLIMGGLPWPYAWVYILSVSFTSCVVSIFLSLIAPMAAVNGRLLIDTSDPDKDSYLIIFDDGEIEELKNKDIIKLKVDPHANLTSSQE